MIVAFVMLVSLIAAGDALASPPANDDFDNAQVLTGSSVTTSGTNLDATKESFESDHAGDPGGASVWYSWTPPSPGEYTIDTCGSDFDTLLAVYVGPSVGLVHSAITSSDQSFGPVCPGSDQSEVIFTTQPSTTYHIVVDGWSDDGSMPASTGAIQLRIRPTDPPPSNDGFASPVSLAGSTDTASGTSAYATKEAGEPNHAGNGGGASVWYSWTAPGSGKYRIDTCLSNFETLLGVYTGGSVNALNPVASDAGGCGGLSRVIFDASSGTQYRIAVDGYLTVGYLYPSMGDVELLVRPASPPPNDNLAGAQVLAGTSASVTGSNVDATKEPGEPNHFGPGEASVWYSWTAPGEGQVTINACGSDFDTLAAVYTGSSPANLAFFGGSDDSPACPGQQSEFSFFAHDNYHYLIAVDGFEGQEGNIALSLHFVSDSVPPPTGTAHARIRRIKVNSRERIAKVYIAADQPNAKFVCQLDQAYGFPCKSLWVIGRRKPWARLTLGWHKVVVAAIDSAGHYDPQPTLRNFKVK